MSVAPSMILDYLRALSGIKTPLWLTGGVAVDFLVGEWTRQHKDLDLISLSTTRKFLRAELTTREFLLARDGPWVTHWRLSGDGSVEPGIEIVFVEPAEANSGVLVIPEGEKAGGRPGRYPLLPGYLDPFRYATLDGVRFRVCSPEGEWYARATSGALVQGRKVEPKIVRDMELLKPLIPEARRLELSAMADLAVSAP